MGPMRSDLLEFEIDHYVVIVFDEVHFQPAGFLHRSS